MGHHGHHRLVWNCCYRWLQHCSYFGQWIHHLRNLSSCRRCCPAQGLALAGLAIAASRSRRSAIEDADSAFAVLAAQEPAQCYRRLICDLATGTLEKSENDFIVSLFNKDVGIESHKFEFATAAKLGKQAKSVQKCELRYNCPLSGEQIQKLF